MKKNTKSKIVLFSVIGLAAISIGTVGFTTWVTRLDKNTETVNTSITVDTASNKTCYVEAVLGDDNSISLTEKTPANNSLIKIEGKDVHETDLKITFKKLKVIVSDEYTFNSLDFTLGAANSNPILNCSYEAGVYPTELYEGSSNATSKLTYFNVLKSSYTTEADGGLVLAEKTGAHESDYIEGYNTYVATSLEFTFKWGTLFGGNKPSEYYKKTNNVTADLQTSATATKVLNHMHECLSGKSVKLTITANVNDKTSSS